MKTGPQERNRSRTCQRCGDWFHSHRSDKRWCGDACKQAASRENRAKRKAEPPDPFAGQDCWQILGVSCFDSEMAIRKAYHKLAFIHHPDRGGDVRKFLLVQDACEKAIRYVKGY